MSTRECPRLNLLRTDMEALELGLAKLDSLAGVSPRLISSERERIESRIRNLQAEIAAFEAELVEIGDLTEEQQMRYMDYRSSLPTGLAREAALGKKIIFLLPGRKFVINEGGDSATKIVINNSGISETQWEKEMGSL